MHHVVVLAIKGVAGGGLVVLFALLSQGLTPKRFAGLFSAAPAVAIAGLIVVLVDKGAHAARQESEGMIAGAIGMLAYAACVIPLLRRRSAKAAAVLALGAWVVVAAAVAVPLLLAVAP